MSLVHQLIFDTARETADGRGWHLSWWSDVVTPPAVPLVTEEYFFRLNPPTGGVPSSTKTVNNKALTTNVVTLTTSAAHGFVAGDFVTVSISDPIFDGTWLLISGSGTTFTYAVTHANVGSTAAVGTAISAPSVSERMKLNYGADSVLLAYFNSRAQATVLAVNAGTVVTTAAGYVTAEGL